MKELATKLDDLMAAFDRPADLPFDILLDLETGELLELSRDTFGLDDEIAEAEASLREKVEAQPDRYEEVPTLSTREAYQLMERFAQTRAHEEDRQVFLRALEGKGAFGRFRDAVRRARQEEDWNRFREEELEQLLRGWLQGLGFSAPASAPRPQVAAAPVAAPTLPGLVDLLVLGRPTEVRGERVLEAASPELARKYFVSVARSICAHVGEDWRRRFVEDTNVFERERFRLRVDGKRVVLRVEVDPAVARLFG